ncbi:hypothetical protein BC567DRAFT_237971 [Phyllosticta citribraziliensis]
MGRRLAAHLGTRRERRQCPITAWNAQSHQPNGNYSTRKGAFYAARAILGERRGRLLVDWCPDELTGETFEPSWVKKKDATARLVAKWKRQKSRRRSGGSQPSKTAASASETPQIDNHDQQPGSAASRKLARLRHRRESSSAAPPPVQTTAPPPSLSSLQHHVAAARATLMMPAQPCPRHDPGMPTPSLTPQKRVRRAAQALHILARQSWLTPATAGCHVQKNPRRR